MRKIIAVVLVVWSMPAFAQSFSCSIGRPACLGYGDQVCSSSGKCVSSDAICFDSFTCNYKGFVCKSGFDEVVEEYDSLVSRVNDLEWCLKRASDMDDVSSCMRRF